MTPHPARDVTPIRPCDVALQHEALLPQRVIETWNRLIAEAWNGYEATILQEDAVKALGGTGDRFSWLNIERIYRRAGWHVVYDKPGFNEDYKAFFTFRCK